jgi:hypothetical protein
MFLGACRLKNRILATAVEICLALILCSCGGYNSGGGSGHQRYQDRVLAAQGVTANFSFGGLVIINGQNDTIPRLAPLSAGSQPGLMAVSPSRNIVMAFDAATNGVFASNTVNETSMGHVQLQGFSSSIIVPTADPVGYAAVPSASVPGFNVLGAVDVMNLNTGAITTTIGVTNAQTVFSNANNTQLLVLSATGTNSVNANAVTVLAPELAVPPVDTSCNNPSTPGNPQPNAVCTVVPGFDQPVFAIINGTTAYVLNCGPECGGTQASVAVLDLNSLTIKQTIPVDAATYAVLSGTVLFVAGTSPTNNACTGQTTAATTCGRLDIVDLTSGTVTASVVITDGYHNHMDFSNNGQLFIGSRQCTNIGNVNIPSGEVRGCLSIYNNVTGKVIVPPDNGDVFGLQSFSSRFIEYVAEGGELRVYDTTKDILLINDFVPQGNINIVGFVGGVQAIDFF